MDAAITMEIKDNAFARQFETITEEGLVSVEYSFQEKKIFLTKINAPDSFDDEEFISNLLKNIMEIAIERKFKVVPILPKIVVFFKKNPFIKSYFLQEYDYKKNRGCFSKTASIFFIKYSIGILLLYFSHSIHFLMRQETSNILKMFFYTLVSKFKNLSC